MEENYIEESLLRQNSLIGINRKYWDELEEEEIKIDVKDN